MAEGRDAKGLIRLNLCTNIVLRSSPQARTDTVLRSSVRCLPPTTTAGRRPGLSGSSRRSATSPWRGVGSCSMTIQRGDLTLGRTSTAFRAAFWENKSVQHLGLLQNRKTGKDSTANGDKIAAAQSGAPTRIVETDREMRRDQ